MAAFTVSIAYDYNSQTYTDLIFDSMDHTPAHNVISPVVKLELNKAGTLEFTAHSLLTSHDDTRQLFNHITPLNTFVTAKYDDIVIFHGRVLYCNTDFYRQKKVYCEGDLAFLVDSICKTFDYTGTGIKKSQLFANLIAAHNSQVEPKKRFTVGTISAGDKDEVIKIKSDNYIETWSAIEQYVLKGSRGFIRTRYENDTTYIDWLAGWDRENETTGFGRTNTQRIEFGRNLLELDDGINANEIFTRLVPIGKDGLTIAVNPNDPIYMDIVGGVQKYGYITRVKEFNDITDKAKLVEKATEYTYYALSGIEHTYSVKAVDLHLQDDAIMNYQLGDVVELYSPLQDIYKTKVVDGQTVSVGVKRVCTAVEYHLADIENTAYSFGIPENADPSESSASSHTSGSGKSTGSKTSSSASSQITTEKKEAEKTEQKYEWVATRTDDNGKILQQAGITLTASGIIHYATDYEYNLRRQFKRVFIQMTNPSENNEIVEGDVWIVTDGIQTWQQMGSVGRSWADSSDLNWEDYAGCKQYIWKNGAWIILNDSAKELYNTTKIEQNAERIALLADNVEAYHTEFVVSANQIRSEVQDTNNALGSRITQTAQQIRSEVWASNSTLYSTIEQTATRIDMKVEAVGSSVAELEITASSITSRVEDAEGNIGTLQTTANHITAEIDDAKGSSATLAIALNGIRSSVTDVADDLHTEILQTASAIQSTVSSTANGLRSEIVQAASQIYSAVYDPDGSIGAMIVQSANQIYSAIYNPSGSIAAMISVSANQIKSYVDDGESLLRSVITQTADSIYAAVYDTQNNVAQLQITTSGIATEVSKKSTIYRQWTDPQNNTPSPSLRNGDVWIKTNGKRTWQGMTNWSDSDGEWNDYLGCKRYVWRDDNWELIGDQAISLSNSTRIDQTEEHIQLVADNYENFHSEFEVTANQIRAEVQDTNNALGSRITQTAQQIKSEVWASNSQLYSTISQTATEIRAEVTNSISELQGSISIQANRIDLVVEGTGTNAHINPASITAAINGSGDSSVNISANHIQFDATHTLEFLSSKMTLSSPSGGGILVNYDAGSEITGCAVIQASKLWGLSSIEVGDSTANDKELLVHGLANVSGKVNISNASSSYTYALEVNGSAKFNSGINASGTISGTLSGTVATGSTVNAATLNVSDSGTYRKAEWKNVGVVTSANIGSKQYYTYTNSSTGTTITGRTYGYLPTGTTTIYYLGRSG